MDNKQILKDVHEISEHEPAEESLDSVIRKMRSLQLFDGVDDPYAELMSERGIENRS